MINKPYVIEMNNQEPFDVIVYTTAAENLLGHLPAIETSIDVWSRLSSKHLQSRSKLNEGNITVLFDALLYAGNTKDRFIKATYSNGKFDEESFEFFHVPKKDTIRKQSFAFYQKRPELIQNASLLNSIQKKLMLKGLSI